MVSARRVLLACALFPSAPWNLRRRQSCLLELPAEETGASSPRVPAGTRAFPCSFPWHARQEGRKHAHDSNVSGGLAACSVALRVLAKLALKMSGRSREPPAEELGATCRFRWQPAEELGATCRFPWQPAQELGATSPQVGFTIYKLSRNFFLTPERIGIAAMRSQSTGSVADS